MLSIQKSDEHIQNLENLENGISGEC